MQHKAIFQAILNFSRAEKRRFIRASLISGVTILLSDFARPLIMAQIIDMIQSGDKTMANFWPIIAAFVAAQLLSFALWRWLLVTIWRAEIFTQHRAFISIFQKLLGHSIRFHSDHFGGALVSQTNKFRGAIENFWDTIIFSLIQLIISFSSALIILSFKFWPYAIVLALTIVAFIVATFVLSKNMAKSNIKEAKATNQLGALLSDDMSNVLALKAFGAERQEIKKAKQKSNNYSRASFQVMRDVNRLMFASTAINSLIQIIALIVAILAQQSGLISMGTILLIVSYTNTVTSRLHEVRHIIRNYNRIVGDASEMTKILNTKIEVADRSTRNLQVTHGKIEFRNVNFSHNAKNKLFQQFNLTIEPGQKVGLVGQSGSGKSSLTSLLLRFYDVESGQILIDGQNIAKLSQNSLRQAIAYVPQEPMMFHRSIRENITLGKAKATLAEVKTAAVQACADEFIKKLPKKYQTVVGERGTKLSGGQRQRIAIARAIIKNAPILVLDEATSALDSESEKLIQDALDELMVGRTSLVVAHRLSTIAKLDRIIVLKNGRIVEDGTHNTLLKQNGVYAKLWQRQSGGFLQEDEVEKVKH